jgi:ferredoxin-NADP reductase
MYNVQSVTLLAKGTVLLTLTPVGAVDVLEFYPGQYAAISFKRGLRPSPARCFSIVSSPNDTKRLQFAIRVGGRFTSAVARLRPGDEVRVQGPFGDFVVDEGYDKRVVLLAGGIGITPFISTLRYMAETRSSLPVTLLYACRSQDDIPFLEELLTLARTNPRLQVLFFVKDGRRKARMAGPRLVAGKIDDEWIEHITDDEYQDSTYFLCGPKGFMKGLGRSLAKQGVPPHRIITESFAQANAPAFGGKMSIQALTYALSAAVLLLGIGGVAALDLDQHLVRQTNATATQPAATNAGSGTTNQDGTSSSTTGTTPTYTQTYQSPVSSVS